MCAKEGIIQKLCRRGHMGFPSQSWQKYPQELLITARSTTPLGNLVKINQEKCPLNMIFLKFLLKLKHCLAEFSTPNFPSY